MDSGHWIYEAEFDPADYVGFVYEITNLESGRRYIGKKQLSARRRKKVKGRKNRKVVIKESNWKDYTSSSETLNADIERLGKDKFQFLILKFCESKRDLGYTEVAEQFKRDVLNARLDSGERAYYNENIMSRFFVNEKHSEETKRKIGEANKVALIGNQIWLGKHHSEESKCEMSKSHKGLIPWNKDVPMREESKEKISKKAKKRWEDSVYRDLVIASHTGKCASQKTKRKMSISAKLAWEKRKTK